LRKKWLETKKSVLINIMAHEGEFFIRLGGALAVPWRCLGGALAVPWCCF
jgi:hypothetical protein